MSDDTPTERFDAAPASGAAVSAASESAAAVRAAGEPVKSRRLLSVLIGVGAALLIAIIILLVVLLTRGSDDSTVVGATPTTSATNSASPTPSESPSVSSSPSSSPTTNAPPPDATGARFTTFSPKKNEDGCHKGGEGPYQDAQVPNISISWNTADAVEAWFITGTDDAADSRFMQIPLSGNQDDFPYPIMFNCATDSTTYTITLVQNSTTHVSKSWTVKNVGDKF